MNAKSFVVGLLVGSAVGAAMGMLFAPQEGAATRLKMSDMTRSAGSKVSTLASNVKEKVSSAAGALRPSI